MMRYAFIVSCDDSWESLSTKLGHQRGTPCGCIGVGHLSTSASCQALESIKLGHQRGLSVGVWVSGIAKLRQLNKKLRFYLLSYDIL